MSAIRRDVQLGQSASHATERDDDLVVAGLAADAREAVGEDAAAEVGGELALDVAREAASCRAVVRRRRTCARSLGSSICLAQLTTE